MSRFLRSIATVLALSPFPALAQTCLVPDDQIVSGGPGKDGIPALTRPAAVSAGEGRCGIGDGAHRERFWPS